MSASEKAKAQIEQAAGRAVRRVAHAMGKETMAAKGAALEARGKGRASKEKGKDRFR
ncbi:hypothetical protein J7E97_28955 [Streptomyces sp. ISL-66]|uniref:hypothetical protein n=1 Tax=Streptomyces sp. ISL-66 TaxID=2819186 RepID=UPI001BE50D01|nr:hypothetical protein [Streptomyces sp. ISL-66]MBT2471787.1 hypothetical protein [Streptomyces sp. ISL-66]